MKINQVVQSIAVLVALLATVLAIYDTFSSREKAIIEQERIRTMIRAAQQARPEELIAVVEPEIEGRIRTYIEERAVSLVHFQGTYCAMNGEEEKKERKVMVGMRDFALFAINPPSARQFVIC